jgi:succinate-acetate transporter protein
MAMFTVEGPEGKLGVALASLLLLLTWAALALPFKLSLIALAVVFVLLALAEVWRERVLDPLGGYFTLRVTLTVGVLISIAWRLALH